MRCSQNSLHSLKLQTLCQAGISRCLRALAPVRRLQTRERCLSPHSPHPDGSHCGAFEAAVDVVGKSTGMHMNKQTNVAQILILSEELPGMPTIFWRSRQKASESGFVFLSSEASIYFKMFGGTMKIYLLKSHYFCLLAKDTITQLMYIHWSRQKNMCACIFDRRGEGGRRKRRKEGEERENTLHVCVCFFPSEHAN